jgi:hypothetical protein
MIHEAGAMAVAKLHGRSSHRVNTEDGAGLIQNSLVWNASVITGAPLHDPAVMAAIRTSRTAMLLDIPLIWDVTKALAQFIEDNDEGDGAYGALGTDCAEERDGEDSAAIELIKNMGRTPGWRWFDGRIEPSKPALVADGRRAILLSLEEAGADANGGQALGEALDVAVAILCDRASPSNWSSLGAEDFLRDCDVRDRLLQ